MAGGGGTVSKFICGYLACNRHLSQAFLTGLPPLIRLNIRDDVSGQWVESALRFSVAQAASRDAGTVEVVAKLSEVFVAEALRRYQRELPPGQTGWLAGAREPAVGLALTLMHHRCAHPWTLPSLAHEVDVSRSVLSERFRHYLGESLSRISLTGACAVLRQLASGDSGGEDGQPLHSRILTGRAPGCLTAVRFA